MRRARLKAESGRGQVTNQKSEIKPGKSQKRRAHALLIKQ
jgi:hypothetical protein